ncbi:hypothetical protein [Kineosporia babensis]|uniref:Heparin binding hemagglutinin HbhA n=1 Tax=Kineosporia babensis TaxID=499548 RepID=A0A9X1N6L7_9ACTN|nr:hypothetical protein [Kineosporia babensis]MCD5309287.1 hypothetical protein [Kineosporia babensis]
MTTTDQEKRPSLPTTPLFAVVGATDLAVQQVRAAAAGASQVQQRFQSDIEARLAGVEKRIGEFDPKTLRSQAEAAYEELARRGKDLFDRVYTQPDSQAFVSQAGNTLNKGKAAVTVARRAADDTASAIRGTLSLGRAEAGKAAEEELRLDQEAVQKAVEVGDGGNQVPGEPTDQAVARTRTSARKTATTARKNAAATKTAAKGTRTSARKTTAAGTRAARSAAKKVGE